MHNPKNFPSLRRVHCSLGKGGILLAAFLFATFFSFLCAAEEGARKAFDLKADNAEKSLKAFSAQSGVEVLFPSDAAAGVRTNAVKGQYTPIEAAKLMLAGTELYVRDESNGVVRIARSTQDPNVQRAVAASDRPGNQSAKAESVSKEAGPIKMATFEVMSSRLLNMDIPRSRDGVQPYVVYDRDSIEQSGATSIDDFLKIRVPMNAVSQSPAQNGRNSTNGNNSRINLRGLGENQTLVLVDGHRTTAASTGSTNGVTQGDLNGIPLGAIERIEILPTTASGIYGGSATGGVVNVILRRDYSGVELRTTYENTFDTDSAVKRVELAAGMNLEGGKTNILFSASYSEANVLWQQDRDFIREYRDRAFANNPAFFLSTSGSPILGATTNIRSTAGTNLTLKPAFGGASLNSPFTFVPSGYTGAATDSGAALVANAGKLNFAMADSAQNSGLTAGRRAALMSAPEIESVMLTVRRQFTPSVQLFLDLSAANNTSHFGYAPSTFTFSVPVSAVTNPFNQALTATVPIPGLTGESVTAVYNRRAVGGVLLRLPHGWMTAVDFAYSQARHFNASPDALQAGAATAVSGGTIDVLRDPASYADAFLPYVPEPSTSGPYQSEQTDGTVRASGPIWTVPAGEIVLSGLAEYRREILHDSYTFTPRTGTENFQPSRWQSVGSAYLETSVPLFAPAQARPGLRALDLQLAGRYDTYAVNGVTSSVAVGSTTPIARASNRTHSANPTMGLRWTPVEGLSLRASYGTGFLPPNVQQVVQSAPNTVTYPSNITDPQRGNTPIGAVRVTSGGNPNLQPENSESWSAGLIVAPPAVPNLRLSVDFTRINKADVITGLTTPLVQVALDNESLFASRITRGPVPAGSPYSVGPVTALDVSSINLSRGEVEAFDVALDYSHGTGDSGKWDFFFNGTFTTHSKTQVSDSLPLVENVGLNNGSAAALKFRGNAGLSYSRGAWSVGWTTRYLDSYWAADPSVATNAPTLLAQGNGGRVPREIYHDIAVRYRLGRPLRGFLGPVLRQPEIRIGVKNLFNRAPAFYAGNQMSYYSYVSDPYQARYSISVKTAW